MGKGRLQQNASKHCHFGQQRNIISNTWQRVEEGEVDRVQRRGALILFVAMVKGFISEAVTERKLNIVHLAEVMYCNYEFTTYYI